jgi:uncharacterized membrane protein
MSATEANPAADAEHAAAAPPAPARSPTPQAERSPAALAPPSLEDTQSAAQAAPAAPLPTATNTARKRREAVLQFACRGNEPAWSLVIDHDTARYLGLQGSEPEAVPLKGKLKVTGEGRTPDIDWRGKAADGSPYKVLIQEQACADTMADAGGAEGRTSFPYRARLTLPSGRVMQGCCSAGLQTAQPIPPAPVWIRRPLPTWSCGGPMTGAGSSWSSSPRSTRAWRRPPVRQRT